MKAREIKISYSTRKRKKVEITCPDDMYELLKTVYRKEEIEAREYFYALYLNTANEVLGWQQISQGGISATVVDIRLILSVALKCLATSIIISHSHPSGRLVPSEEDKIITTRINRSAKLMGIDLLDHIIFTRDGYYSFAKGCGL